MRPLAQLVSTTLTISILVLAGAPALAATGADTADHSQGNPGTSGRYDEPQPSSTADQNPGGANGDCPGGTYCSTRDGSASGNGNGDGKATGEPCAGCVGKADNKNPKGQSPDAASDGNAGYECDSNRGIGQSNPAHTGCSGGTTQDQQASARRRTVRGCDQGAMTTAPDATCAPCPDDATMSGGTDCAAPVPAAGTGATATGTTATGTTATGAGDSVAATGAGHAARPAAVLGVEAVRARSAGGPGAPAEAAAPLAGLLPDSVLPSTGAGALLDVLLLAGAGLVCLGGYVMVTRRRARRA